MTKLSKDSFPKDFIWGAAISAAQAEGASSIDGKLPSVWDDFSKRKWNLNRKIANHGIAHNPLNSAEFYHHYKADIQILKQLNFKAFRFSTAWSRILPNGTGSINYKGIDFYNRLIDELLQNEIDPWITMYHWDLPMDLQKKGGWVNRDVLNWFENYAYVLLHHFSDRVKHWMVLNEPLAFTAAGHFLGVHAPGKIGINNFMASTHHALLVQANVGQQIKNYNSNLKAGTTFSSTYITAHSHHEKDTNAAKRADALYNRLFLEPYLGLGLPIKELPFLKRIEKYTKPEDNYQFKADFIGIQNYTREVVKHSWWMPYIKTNIIPADKRNVPITAMKWEIIPESIYHALTQLQTYNNLPPIVLTEVGAAFNDLVNIDGTITDTQRIDFFEQFLTQINKAMQEGAKVDGLFVWSLLDNFEWAEGYHPRFGLVHVDFKTQQRIVKQSGKWFKDFLKS